MTNAHCTESRDGRSLSSPSIRLQFQWRRSGRKFNMCAKGTWLAGYISSKKIPSGNLNVWRTHDNSEKSLPGVLTGWHPSLLPSFPSSLPSLPPCLTTSDKSARRSPDANSLSISLEKKFFHVEKSQHLKLLINIPIFSLKFSLDLLSLQHWCNQHSSAILLHCSGRPKLQ